MSALAEYPLRKTPSRVSTEIAYLLDPLLAAGMLLISLPLLSFSALTIAVISRRSPFVGHERVGQSGRPFLMLKLRSMWSDSPAPTAMVHWVEKVGQGDPESKAVGDPRVQSRFARFCRRYSIDELPQLLHVLRGEMSLVGPRPITRAELSRHYGADAEETLELRPGITGLWQIRGRNRLTYERRRRLDLILVRRFSLKLYLAILWRTIPRTLSGSNAW